MNELRRHARAWLEEHGDPWADAGRSEPNYSTSGNPWLWEAEKAFTAELARWRDEHPAAPAPPSVPRTGFYVYRLWADDGRLLYVGSSQALRARLKRHRETWGDLIASETWEQHSDARSMLAAEAHAIRTEFPALNKALV